MTWREYLIASFHPGLGQNSIQEIAQNNPQILSLSTIPEVKFSTVFDVWPDEERVSETQKWVSDWLNRPEGKLVIGSTAHHLNWKSPPQIIWKTTLT